MRQIEPYKLDRRQPFALYVHLPFCHYRCHYCDFYASAGVHPLLRRKVVDRIRIEIVKQLHYLDVKTLDSVYFGGGTPSMIDGDQLRSLIHLVQTYKPRQVTIEVNPEDIDPPLLENLEVNSWNNIRISMGIQTLHQLSLDAVGRKVTVAQIETSLDLLSPYKTLLNLDLIAGLPFHTKAIVLHDLIRITEYKPSHISLYALAMEQGTVLTYREHPQLPKDEERSEQWQLAQKKLLEQGYHQYEVSNYALASHAHSVQNMHYWQLKPYIGIGPGAVGTLVLEDGSAVRVTGCREFTKWQDSNVTDLWQYEPLDRSTFIFEHYMMGLRTTLGVNKSILLERFGEEGLKPWYRLKESKWHRHLWEQQEYLTLTEEGRLFLDAILLELL